MTTPPGPGSVPPHYQPGFNQPGFNQPEFNQPTQAQVPPAQFVPQQFPPAQFVPQQFPPPQSSPSPAPKRRSRAGLWFGMVGVALVFALIAGTAVWFVRDAMTDKDSSDDAAVVTFAGDFLEGINTISPGNFDSVDRSWDQACSDSPPRKAWDQLRNNARAVSEQLGQTVEAHVLTAGINAANRKDDVVPVIVVLSLRGSPPPTPDRVTSIVDVRTSGSERCVSGLTLL